VDAAGNHLPYDQRGQGFARIVGPAVDIGAFELQTLVSEPPPSNLPEDKEACKKEATMSSASGRTPTIVVLCEATPRLLKALSI